MYTDGFFEKYRTDNFANKVTNIIDIVAAFVRAIAKSSLKSLRELVMVGVWYKKHRGHPFDTCTISAINKSGSSSSHLLQ